MKITFTSSTFVSGTLTTNKTQTNLPRSLASARRNQANVNCRIKRRKNFTSLSLFLQPNLQQTKKWISKDRCFAKLIVRCSRTVIPASVACLIMRVITRFLGKKVASAQRKKEPLTPQISLGQWDKDPPKNRYTLF